MTTIQYIDTPEKLEALCQLIKSASWVALDTEFLREKTYYPKFCLLQIATPDWVACVDPIALPDLNKLFDVLYLPTITKIFHSCRQDLEIFFQLRGGIPQPIFDTQLAAPLLGFQDNTGYAMLVSSFLNVNLSKAYTRTDWSVRPLSPEQLDYAADDVIYLCKIYQIMCKQLSDLGRLNWLNDDFEQLNDPELYQLSPENAWFKIKGKNKLTGKQLSIIQTLSAWREQIAQHENRPRNWLIRDELLIELAKLQPESLEALVGVREIQEKTVNRYGKVLCQLITDAKQRPPIPLNEKEKSLKKTPEQEAILDLLAALVRLRADQNRLNPSILASRKDLEDLLDGRPEGLLLQGWRRTMVGNELIALLEGSSVLSVNPKTIQLLPYP
ncbi:MAG: ribonuclease D [Methylococcaceae bacterium]|nr:ribonuclease D [Methylococcaceae bacterium]